MCGRFTLSTPTSTLARLFGVDEALPLDPRFNIAPTQDVAVVRVTPGREQRELALLHWGLVPSWAKEIGIGNKMINARAETVAEKPAYRSALRYRRCLIPADGFYEWRDLGHKRKQPYFFRMKDGRPFAFAGLWERWEDPKGGFLDSCTLLTTEANEVVADVHDRMPVILRPEDYPLWLDIDVRQPEKVQPLLRPYDPDEMMGYPVSSGVNNPRHDEAYLIEPAGGEADAGTADPEPADEAEAANSDSGG